MSLNYSCHVGQLSCHGCSTTVAMYGLVYCSCHDFKTLGVATHQTLGSCHVALQKGMAKKHVWVKRESCHVLTSTLGQLPCKRKSCHLLMCTLGQLSCTMQKHMATRVKESCHLLTSKARAVAMYPAETHGN